MTKRTTGARKTTRQKNFEEEPIPFRVRLEPKLYERFWASAMKNRNSLCLEIRLLLEKALETVEAEPIS
jgi:hypothetical protein